MLSCNNHYKNEKKTRLGVAQGWCVCLACVREPKSQQGEQGRTHNYIYYTRELPTLTNLSSRKVEQVQLRLRFKNVHVDVVQAL